MHITHLQSGCKILQNTTVKGDPEKIDAVKKMGHGMLSHAFRVGCDIVLGIGAEDYVQLKKEVESVTEEINILQSKREIILSKMKNIETFENNVHEAVRLNDEKFEFTVSEYKRCAPSIIYRKMTQQSEYLAGLLSNTHLSEVRAFFANRTIEPTEEEIRTFLMRG